MIYYRDINNINKTTIQNEQAFIKKLHTLQKNKKNNLLNCLLKINNTIQTIDNIDNLDTLNTSIEFLQTIKTSLNNIYNNILELEKLNKLLTDSFDDFNNLDFINEYNELFINCYTNICENELQIDKCISQYITYSFFVFPTEPSKEEKESTITETSNTNEQKNTVKQENLPELTDNPVLLISEKKNKVFLPYTIVELQNILEKNNNYKSLQEIINKKFIISLEKYKNPIIARFRESYYLMKNKQKASTFDSLDLALELCFNSLLNPAIITACKNLDELDIYLDCLNSNELDKFKFFEIKYEYLPTKK